MPALLWQARLLRRFCGSIEDAPENGTLDINAAEGLLANDIDASLDGDALTIVAPGTRPAAGIGGTAVVDADGAFRYTAPTNTIGTATIAYEVQGANGERASATATIDVVNRNDPPRAVDDALPAIVEDGGDLLIAASTLLANDDAGPNDSQDSLTVSAVTNAVGGTVTLGDPIRFSPAPDFFGAAGFSYSVRDLEGLEATATVSFTVDPVNDPPSFTIEPNLAYRGGEPGPRSEPGFAREMSPGPGESAQLLTAFTVEETSDPDNVISSAALALDGTLFLTLTGETGVADFEVTLADDAGGVSAPLPFSVAVDVPAADLSITIEPVTPVIERGEEVSYAIRVANAGPAAVEGATVTHEIPTALLGAAWTCEPDVGASCTASGDTRIEDSVDLAPGAGAIYMIVADHAPAAAGRIPLNATILAPANVGDPDAGNDEASAEVLVDGLFRDRFE